jgi:hypothetical protein
MRSTKLSWNVPCFSGEPKPGSKRDRDIMRVMQPGFLEAFAEAAQRADDASFHDNQGANSHTAVTSWISMCKALGIARGEGLGVVESSMRRSPSYSPELSEHP